MTKQEIINAVKSQSETFSQLATSDMQQVGEAKVSLYRYCNIEEEAAICATEILANEALEQGDRAIVQFEYDWTMSYEFNGKTYTQTGSVKTPIYTMRINTGEIYE